MVKFIEEAFKHTSSYWILAYRLLLFIGVLPSSAFLTRNTGYIHKNCMHIIGCRTNHNIWFMLLTVKHLHIQIPLPFSIYLEALYLPATLTPPLSQPFLELACFNTFNLNSNTDKVNMHLHNGYSTQSVKLDTHSFNNIGKLQHTTYCTCFLVCLNRW